MKKMNLFLIIALTFVSLSSFAEEKPDLNGVYVIDVISDVDGGHVESVEGQALAVKELDGYYAFTWIEAANIFSRTLRIDPYLVTRNSDTGKIEFGSDSLKFILNEEKSRKEYLVLDVANKNVPHLRLQMSYKLKK